MPEGEKGRRSREDGMVGPRISCSCSKTLLNCEEKQSVRGHLAGAEDAFTGLRSHTVASAWGASLSLH